MYVFIYLFLERGVKRATLGQAVATRILDSVKLKTVISHLVG